MGTAALGDPADPGFSRGFAGAGCRNQECGDVGQRARAYHSGVDCELYRNRATRRGRGIAGLCRRKRSNAGADLVIVSRRWDRDVPFSAEKKKEIRAKLQRKVRSPWAAGAAGWNHIARFAKTELVKLTRAAGVSLPDAEMLRLCAVPRRFAEKERRHQILAIKDNDAKRFADDYAPRVRRSRDGLLPMSIVVADVHHTDILFQRPDGSICTPKAIAWHDLATNRLFMTIVFLAPKEGVRQEHVVASFIAMTQNPEWGMPGKLYLDNGGEFKKLGFVDDAMRLAALSQGGGFAVLDDEPATGDGGCLAAIHGDPRATL